MADAKFRQELQRLMDDRNISARRLAKIIHYHPSYLSKVINGHKPPSTALATRVDDALDARGRLLALVPRPGCHDQSGARDHSTGELCDRRDGCCASTDWHAADGPGPVAGTSMEHVDAAPSTSDAKEVRRNQFLRLTGATVASLLAPPLVHAWRDRHPMQVPSLDELLLAQLRAQNEGFRWLDRQEGAAHLLGGTTQHARRMIELWRLTDARHPLRNDLAELAGDACHLVAYQAFDQGERTRAVEWYRCAAELASQVPAQDLYVFAMCGVAYMHARNRESELAQAIVHQLTELPLSAAAHCYVAVYEAHAHAAANRRDAALAALDRAACWSEQTADEAPSPWLGIPDQSFVTRQRALILAEFGDQEALDVLTWLDQHTPSAFQRFRVTLQTTQALLHARNADADQSAVLLQAAHHRNRQIRSAEKTALMLEVRSALQPYETAPDVRTFDELFAENHPDLLKARRARIGR